MTRAELEALAVRVETEEPSDWLDGDIWNAVGKPIHIGELRYTTSIDDAVTLVPEGWRWLMQSDGIALLKNGISQLLPGHSATRGNADGRPAAALTAAALRALAPEAK